jgi:hypothetical protein
MQARTSAPASVDSAGTISSAPDRTMITATKVAASENSAMRRAQMASREIGASVNCCRRIQGVLSLVVRHGVAASRIANGIIFASAPLVLALCASANEGTLLVKQAFDLDLNAFTRRTAVADASHEERARLLCSLSFNAPFLDPRHQHPGVEEAGFAVGRGLRDEFGGGCRGGPGHA